MEEESKERNLVDCNLSELMNSLKETGIAIRQESKIFKLNDLIPSIAE
jgi:hypothetical protein